MFIATAIWIVGVKELTNGIQELAIEVGYFLSKIEQKHTKHIHTHAHIDSVPGTPVYVNANHQQSSLPDADTVAYVLKTRIWVLKEAEVSVSVQKRFLVQPDT